MAINPEGMCFAFPRILRKRLVVEINVLAAQVRSATYAMWCAQVEAKSTKDEMSISTDAFLEDISSDTCSYGYLLSSSMPTFVDPSRWFYDPGKETYEELSKPEKINQSLDELRTFLLEDYTENDDSKNRNLDDDKSSYALVNGCQPSSTSQNALQKDLGEKIPPSKSLGDERRQEKQEGKIKEQSRAFKNTIANLNYNMGKLIAQTKCQLEIMKKMENENSILRKQLECLKTEHREILAELGRISVEQAAKEKEKRMSELFKRTFLSPPPGVKRCVGSDGNAEGSSEGRKLGYPNYRQNGNVKVSKTRPTNPEKNNTDEDVKNPNEYAPTNDKSVSSVRGAEAMAPKVYQQSRGSKENEKRVNSIGKRNKKKKNNEKSIDVSSESTNASNNGNAKSQQGETSGGESVNTSEEVREEKESSSFVSNPKGENEDTSSTRQSDEDLPYSVEEDSSSEKGYISLGSVPPTSVASTVYNNYKLLLLTLGQSLLASDVMKLKNWASQLKDADPNFSINISQNSTQILFQLDQKAVINASDLSRLRDFFESILRYDLVHIIDVFLLGDYTILRQIATARKRETQASGLQSVHRRTISAYPAPRIMADRTLYSFQGTSNGSTAQSFENKGRSNAGSNLGLLRKPERKEKSEPQSPVGQPTSALPNSSGNPFPTAPDRNQSLPSTQHGEQTSAPRLTGFNFVRKAPVVAADSHVTNEITTTSSNSSTRANPSVRNQPKSNQTLGSNGLKHSRFARPDQQRNNAAGAHSPGASRNQAPDNALGSNWLCTHYKRRCYVKFQCCDKFWPCHRCHNNQSNCGQKKLKSRDTQMIKCVDCNKEQQFGHYCVDCNTKFANYYCGLCKHLTGTDDHPYHCEKCGICRIHGDRSFHCDVCGVCLDVQLRGNHKCREGSAHDECCICLEDAFTGCQILPCSHKVHKDCATQMIRSGITRCPICRESFAHKLERRPPQNRKKPPEFGEKRL